MKNSIFKITKTLAYLLVFAALSLAVLADVTINVASPIEQQYNVSSVSLSGTISEQVDEISYALDSSAYSSLCTSCNSFSKSLDSLSDGSHTVTVLAVLNLTNYTATKTFSVNTTVVPVEALVLNVISPTNITYTAKDVALSFTSNHNANLSYELDSGSAASACNSCNNFATILYNLSNGAHTMKVIAVDEYAQSVQTDRAFIINYTSPTPEALVLNVASPLNQTYTTNNISLSSTTNHNSNITYELDGNSAVSMCNNCVSSTLTLYNLSNGAHILKVKAVDEYAQSAQIDKAFNVNLSQPIESLALYVISPLNMTYASRNVSLSATTSRASNITYELDGNSAVSACNNCTGSFTILYNLSLGVHLVKVRAVDGFAQTAQVNREFNVNVSEPPVTLNLNVISPLNQTYSTDNITLSATTNKLANISYKLGAADRVVGCTNCTSYSHDFVDMNNGFHDLWMYASDNSTQVEVFRRFYVNATAPERNETHRNFTGGYARGFEKLPKDFASGNVTNADLIEIMQSNKLNPGVLNRLIKTGKLSNESITVMIETQFMPPGLMHKLFGWLGWGHNGLVEDLMKYYNLSEAQIQELINKQTLPKNTLEKLIKKRALSEETIQALIEKINNTKNQRKVYEDLAKYQTLTPENVNALLNFSGFKKNVVKNLVKYQVLDNDTVSALTNWTKDKNFKQEIQKNQRTEERENARAQQVQQRIEQIRNRTLERIENIKEKSNDTWGNKSNGNGKGKED
jgi:hypothetical protein